MAVYRAYNPNELAHNHNFTPDVDDRDALVCYGWDDEGIAIYGAKAAA